MVTVAEGSTTISSMNVYTYVSGGVPFISSVTPSRSGTGGGTRLTITGSGYGYVHMYSIYR